MATIFERKQQILERIPSGHHRDHIDEILAGTCYPELISEPRVVQLARKESVAIERLPEERIGKLVEEWARELDTPDRTNKNIPVRVFIAKCASSGLFFDQSWTNLLVGSQRVRNIDVIEELILYFNVRSINTGIKPDSNCLGTLIQLFDIGCKEYEAFRHFDDAVIKGWLRAVLTFSFLNSIDEETVSNLVVRSIPWPYYSGIIRWAKGWSKRKVYTYPEIWDVEFLRYFSDFFIKLIPDWKTD